MRGTLPFRSSRTWAAVVGLGRPELLAEGAAMGRPQVFNISAATGWEGIRIATVGSPAVTSGGTAGFRINSMVKGPGQKASISGRASGETVQRSLSWARS